MDFHLDETIAILRRTPRVLDALLRDLPEPWIRGHEGAGTWSPFDIVGHLIHGEKTDWIPRARIIIEKGETQPFEPFDRFAQEAKSAGRSMPDLLDTFGDLRAANLDVLLEWQLTHDDMHKRGMHPHLGSVSLGQLLATWAAHDLSHIAQVTRVMSRQYTAAVGPWRGYLPILQ